MGPLTMGWWGTIVLAASAIANIWLVMTNKKQKKENTIHDQYHEETIKERDKDIEKLEEVIEEINDFKDSPEAIKQVVSGAAKKTLNKVFKRLDW